MSAGQPIQCKASIAWGPNEPLKLETIQVDPPQAGEVRIRLSAASICHTDATILTGVDLGIFKFEFPIILGHEAGGVVESCGEGVTSVQTGDKVIVVNVPQCGRCWLCLGNKTNACVELDSNIGHGYIDKNKTTRFRCRGQTVYHCLGVSSFTEYTVCREEFVAKVNPTVELDKACLLSCGVRTGYGAALNSAKVEPGSSVGIWGLGAVGLSAVIGCKKAGASRIIAIDPNTAKYELALKFGATDCLDPLEDSFDAKITALTQEKGLDYAIECVGNLGAMKQAIASTNMHWGQTTIVGVTPGEAQFHVGNAIQFLLGRRLNGSWMGGVKTRDSTASFVDDYIAGTLPLGDFITHRVDLAGLNNGFELVKSGKCVKTVVDI